MSEAALALAASPTKTGMMWEMESMRGRPAPTNSSFKRCALACMMRRSHLELARCCTLASAPAATTGGMDVVKMNPGAVERMVSMRGAEAARYPPTTPYALPSVPVIMVSLLACPSRSEMPPPLSPYSPTACTSSQKVMAPNSSARSQMSDSGATVPSMLFTLSKAMSLGACGSASASNRRKSSMSLCL